SFRLGVKSTITAQTDELPRQIDEFGFVVGSVACRARHKAEHDKSNRVFHRHEYSPDAKPQVIGAFSWISSDSVCGLPVLSASSPQPGPYWESPKAHPQQRWATVRTKSAPSPMPAGCCSV